MTGHDPLQQATAVLDGHRGAHVVGMAGHQHALNSGPSRDSKGLTQHLRGVTAATKAGTNSIADVTPHLREVGVELVPNRNSAYNLPPYLGDEKRRGHPAFRQVNAKTQALQPVKVDRPCLPLRQVEKELEAILHKLLVCQARLRFVPDSERT